MINFEGIYKYLSTKFSSYRFLLAYTFWTCAINSGVMGSANDEVYYRGLGLRYMSTHDFSYGIDHPPFFMWVGAFLPYFVSPEFAQLFRLSNIIIFLFLLFWGSSKLRERFGEPTAYVFVILVSLCPNFKAHSGIHGNDFLPTLLILFSAICLICDEGSFRNSVRSSLIYSLSILSKISSGFFLPFYLLGEITRSKFSGRVLIKAVFGGLVGVFLAFLISYHFNIFQLGNFIKSIEFQLDHNEGGHSQYFFGQNNDRGVWYYYLLLSLFKLTPLHIITLLASFVIWFRRFNFDNSIRLTLLPALVFLVILSSLDVQLGFRYFLPGLALLYLGAAIILGPKLFHHIRSHGKGLVQISRAACFVVTLLFFIDLSTLLAGSYISYFNFLSPTPTRYFSDSNIDWGQDLPEHQKLFTLKYKNFGKPKELFSKSDDLVYLRVGASELNGHWGQRVALKLKDRQPNFTLSGFEFFTVSKGELFDMYWSSGQHQKAATPDCPSNGIQVEEVLKQDKIFIKADSKPGILFLNYENTSDYLINGTRFQGDRNWSWIPFQFEDLEVDIQSYNQAFLLRKCL